MPVSLKVLLLTLFLIFPLFFSKNVYAQEYFFQEEFNQQRASNSLDPDKWIIHPNTQAGFTTVKEEGGNLSLSQQDNTTQFPLVVSKNQALPSGDFSAEIKFAYTNITFWGTGIALAQEEPTNGGGFSSLLTIGAWQDKTLSNMRIGFNGVDVYTTPVNTDSHILKVDRVGKKYLLFLDGTLIFTSPDITKQVKFIWMGNPTIQPPIPTWTSFKVDYIRVIQNFPEPFLDLPWDYQSQSKSFEEVALNPQSWFDHKYPLQNIPCCINQVSIYTGANIKDFYRSHNGYDYALKNGVKLNTPVLAAASGWATFTPMEKSAGAGNVIKIDHQNSYQSWYEHLSSDDLLAHEGQKIFVNKGQQIGKVGMTGNTTGPHIHFSIFKDTDSDSSFEDEIPHGVTDPLGWEGDSPDPWSQFTVGGKNGAPSFSLFTARAKPKSVNIPTSGGFLSQDKINITAPDGVFTTPFELIFKSGPFEAGSNLITSVVPSFFLNAFDNLGQAVSQFLKPIEISYNYSNADLSNINEDSLQIYSFNQQSLQWEGMPTTLDKINNTAVTQTTHFSQFALMGEIKDLIAPMTEVVINGLKGQDNWYRSDISIKLNGQDNHGGIGMQYTLFTLNGDDWFEFTQPIVFVDEGLHKITYQSYDKAENKEGRKTVDFNIDKILPEARIFIDLSKKDLVVEGIDQHLDKLEKLEDQYLISDLAGNTLKLGVKEKDKDKKDDFRINSLQYNDNQVINLEDNHYKIKYKNKNNQLIPEEQTFKLKDEIKIKIKYDSKKNKSSIFTRQAGKEKLKEVRDGLVLLQLTTNQGTLEYSY